MSADSYLTMDLETVDMNGNIVPYLACAYNKDNYIEVFAKDVLDKQSRDNMFKIFIDRLTQIRGFKYVYAHNLSTEYCY